MTYLRVLPFYELYHPWPFSTVRVPTHICLPRLKEVWGWLFWHLWTSMTGDSVKAFTAWKNHLLSTNRVRVALPQNMLAFGNKSCEPENTERRREKLTVLVCVWCLSELVCMFWMRVYAACVCWVPACRFCNAFHASPGTSCGTECCLLLIGHPNTAGG